MRILTLAVLSVLGSGCFLFHETGGEEAPAPEPTPVPRPSPVPFPDPDPGPERDYCEEEPDIDGRCSCGHEVLVHPDEEGRCFRCLDCGDCEIPIAEDGPLYPDALISWQSPGGFAGWGPAVIVTGDGTVRIWHMLLGFDPSAIPEVEPDIVTTVPFYEVDQLVERWKSADRSTIPRDGPGADCYPTAAVRQCEGCELETIQYSTPDQVLPELGCVFDWYDTRLADVLEYPPRAYCAFRF